MLCWERLGVVFGCCWWRNCNGHGHLKFTGDLAKTARMPLDASYDQQTASRVGQRSTGTRALVTPTSSADLSLTMTTMNGNSLLCQLSAAQPLTERRRALVVRNEKKRTEGACFSALGALLITCLGHRGRLFPAFRNGQQNQPTKPHLRSEFTGRVGSTSGFMSHYSASMISTLGLQSDLHSRDAWRG